MKHATSLWSLAVLTSQLNPSLATTYKGYAWLITKSSDYVILGEDDEVRVRSNQRRPTCGSFLGAYIHVAQGLIDPENILHLQGTLFDIIGTVPEFQQAVLSNVREVARALLP